MSEPAPTAEQERAISAIVAWYADTGGPQEFFLDGEAGVGKSWTAGAAVKRLDLHRVISGAFTGKAALVMRKKGVEGATTIHSMIYKPTHDARTGKLEWVISDESPAATADLIVIDEVSMVNDRMANDLRSFGQKILVLGDVDGQLPPIEGGGAFTNRRPDFRLKEPNRFALSSPIFRCARIARTGAQLDFGRYETEGDGPPSFVDVLPLTRDTWQRIYEPDTQVLCGVHATRWKVSQLLRENAGFSGPIPLAGEKIICCRNSFDVGLINGAFGIMAQDAEVWERDQDGDDRLYLTVRMEDHIEGLDRLRTHPYLFRQHFVGPSRKPEWQREIHEFDWGYCITTHKAQGSEWDDVTVIDDGASFRDADTIRRWRYTAITRAARNLTILRRVP